MNKTFLLFLAFFITPFAVGQNIVTDTVFVDFVPDTLIPLNINVAEIHDNRSVPPKFISYSQTKKFLLIPVDQEVSTRSALAFELLNSLHLPDTSKEKYRIDIDYFLIETFKGKLSHPYYLRADLPIFHLEDTGKTYIGTLSYNMPYYSTNKKTPFKETCEDMLSEWHRNLKLDLIGLQNPESFVNNPPERFLPQRLKVPHYLNITTAGIIGINFWQLEAELYLTRPETGVRSKNLANIIRYQNNKHYEMITFGKQVEHYNKRLTNNWSTDIATDFCIGLNKWKEKGDIELYQLVSLVLSSNQCVVYNKVNESSWLLKTGLSENFSYVIKKRPKLLIGLYISAEYKF